jgi:hypothetical protein
MDSSPYDVLGVLPASEPEVIDAAYRALMKKYHPDRWQGAAGESRERAQAINAAYAAIRPNGSTSKPTSSAPQADYVWPEVAITPPIPTHRNLAWATGISIAILAGIAAAVTGR